MMRKQKTLSRETTGRALHLPLLCSGMPLDKYLELAENSPTGPKLAKNIIRQQRGPLDKVRRVEQLRSFAFGAYLLTE